MNLTIEQEFALQSFNHQVDQMSREQAQAMLKKLYEQSMIRESIYKKLIRTEWGL